MPDSAKAFMNSKVFIRWLPLLAVVLLVIHHFSLVNSYSINLPYQDDIFDFLHFINQVESAGSGEEVFDAFFAQHNDHRTAATRLQVYALYAVQGEVNFQAQALLSNIGLVLILFLFYLAVRKEEYCWLYLLVAALFLFSLRAYRVVAWAQPAFAYFYVYFYTFACLFALHRVTPLRFVLALLFAVLASFTLALGQVAWVLGVASLLHQAFVVRSRSWLYPAAWLLIATGLIISWYFSYTAVSFGLDAEDLERAQRFSEGILIDPTPSEWLARFTAFSLVMLGSAVTESNAILAGAVGLVMVSILVYMTLRYIKEEDSRLVLCSWFCVAAIPALAMARAAVGTPSYFLATNNRYSFFSMMLICLLCLLLQYRLKIFKTPMVYALVLLALVFHGVTYYEFKPRLEEMKEHRISLHNDNKIPVFTYTQKEIRTVLRKADAGGRYTLFCRPYPECESAGGQ